MRSVSKGKQPATLTDVQCASTTNLATVATARAAFDQLDKAAMRDSLCVEQGWLCAFCMRRLDPKRRDGTDFVMKIAHRVPIAVTPSQALDWSNHFGSCDGGQRSPSRIATGDFAQENVSVSLDPSSALSVGQLRLVRRGSAEGLFLETDNPTLKADLETLHLNGGDLPILRDVQFRTFQTLLRKAHHPSTWTPAVKSTFLAKWLAQRRELPEFAGVPEAWVLRNMRCG